MNDVERVYRELLAIKQLLETHGDMSDQVAFNEISAKTIVLCAASYFEKEITQLILSTAKETGTHGVFCTFIDKQALQRRFHSMFEWDRSNVNKFFGLFGKETQDKLVTLVQRNQTIGSAIKEFIFLNARRNELVHGNFAGLQAEITLDEGYAKFNRAIEFLAWLPKQLQDAAKNEEAAVG